jgi:hypothetical protein
VVPRYDRAIAESFGEQFDSGSHTVYVPIVNMTPRHATCTIMNANSVN